jgi:hypothetical protein
LQSLKRREANPEKPKRLLELLHTMLSKMDLRHLTKLLRTYFWQKKRQVTTYQEKLMRKTKNEIEISI